MADISRKTTGLELTPEATREIWQDALYQSAFMQLIPQMQLPGAGVRVPIITGDLDADWVDETAMKPKSTVGFDKKDMAGYTLATIIPFSNQFRRDYGALYDAIVQRAPGAIARKFDKTVMGLVTKPGDLFDNLADAPKISLGNTVWKSLNKADDSVSDANGTVTGWALSPHGRSVLRQATDSNGRPLFLASTGEKDVNTVLGNPVYISKGVGAPAQEAGTEGGTATPEILGVTGEFTSAAWGSVEGLQTSISDQATITIDGEQVNLWEHNMFAVRVEMEVGFRVRDINRYAILTA